MCFIRIVWDGMSCRISMCGGPMGSLWMLLGGWSCCWCDWFHPRKCCGYIVGHPPRWYGLVGLVMKKFGQCFQSSKLIVFRGCGDLVGMWFFQCLYQVIDGVYGHVCGVNHQRFMLMMKKFNSVGDAFGFCFVDKHIVKSVMFHRGPKVPSVGTVWVP